MIWKLITSLVGGGINEAVTAYKEAQIEKIKAASTEIQANKEITLARLQSDVELARVNKAANSEALQMRTKVRLATADHWEMRLVTAIVAIPVTLHYGFTIIDHIYGFGWNIQPLPGKMAEWQELIILSLFGLSSLRSAVNVVAARILR